MSNNPLQAFKAQQNSEKIENALLHVKHRDQDDPLGNPTIFIDDNGDKFSTTARALPSVEPPVSKIPSDEEVFGDNNIPNYKFLMQHFKKEGRLSEFQISLIVSLATEILEEEANLIHVSCPATVVGDIHGQYYDLCKLLDMCGDPAKTQYLFLGDYVDRGDYSIEVLILLYAIKINFPTSFWLLRGNHESKRMTDYFTFKRECQVKYIQRAGHCQRH
ncbi:unnamed protein product [Ambrosiozyma monospora]|uniref:Unnamed protein product n=1 Tax=Ambrosiozyma monospora TaxID=43982 RepID=A0ACB5TSY9_AMBMO|nr:unnamed protein product [Ambrosiozyma monospora]